MRCFTGSACNGFQGNPLNNQDCPFTRTNGDGSQTVVDSLPMAPDRIMLRTGQDLFTADAPISTAVHLGASAGFLKVNLDGVQLMSLAQMTTPPVIWRQCAPRAVYA